MAAVGELSQEEEGELGLQYFAVYIYELPCLILVGLGRMMSIDFHATGKNKTGKQKNFKRPDTKQKPHTLDPLAYVFSNC